MFFRDISDGRLFYVYGKNEVSSINLFLMRDHNWVGSNICIYEPDYEFEVGGTPTISTEQPLLPVRGDVVGGITSPYAKEWAVTSSVMKGVYVQEADVQLHRVNVIEACGAQMCDSQHDVGERCCALTCTAPKKLILRCIVSSTAAGITKAKFQSCAWTRIFMDEDSMKVMKPNKYCKAIHAPNSLWHYYIIVKCQ